jgi:hypothetical protein
MKRKTFDEKYIMKTNSIKSLITGAILILTAACSSDTLPVYEDVTRIYFAWATVQPDYNRIDNRTINLGYDNPVKSDSTIQIPVRLLGRLANTNRPVSAEIIRSESSAIPGVDIEILPSFIPADSASGYLSVRIINSEKLTKNQILARIRLTPNEFFHTDMNFFPGAQAGLEYNIYFDSMSDMPNLWKDSRGLNQYFGKWSKVKENLLCELLGITRDWFMYNAEDLAIYGSPDAVLNSRMTSDIAFGIIAIVNRYLRDYKEANNGNPLLDENGEEVKTPIGVW